jgi:hypothetical protein
MGKYRVTLEIQLADELTPDHIQPLMEEHLAHDTVYFKDVKVRSIEGEFLLDRDDFDEWRYCLGEYAHARERMIEFLRSPGGAPQGFRLGPR